MLLTIAGIIVALWLLGLATHIAGGFINLLLIVAIIMLVAHLMGRHANRI